jgi:hypothetical protein
MIDISYKNGCKQMSKFYFYGWSFLIVLAYPPLIFTDKLSDALRITCFFLLTLYLFSKTKILLRRHVVSISLLIILIGIQLIQIDFENQVDVRNAGSLFLTLAFAIALDRASTNNVLSAILAKFYIYLFTLIPILMIFAIGFYFVFGGANPFNLNIGAVDSNMFIHTPFGVLLPKFTDSVFLRSTNFFHEPVFLAFFLAINTYLPVIGSGFCARNFNKLNFVGGILTLSFLYGIIVITVLWWRAMLQFRPLRNIIITGFLFILVLLVLNYQVLETMSSLSDRLDRMYIYVSLYPMLSSTELWLGTGFNVATGFDKAMSAGVFSLLYKLGIVGLVSIVTLIWMFARKNMSLLIACLFALFSFEPYLFPLFWLAITSYVVVSRQSSEYAQNSAIVKARA